MKILILDTITFGDDIDLGAFKELGDVYIYKQSTTQQAMDRIKEHNPEIIIENKISMTARMMQQAPALRMIAETATGYNNIDLEYAESNNIAVANVAGYSTQSVIQHTFALCFYVLEKLSYYDNYVKSGQYEKCPCFTHFDKVFPELYGKTWGIIGLGEIGRGVARVAESFGCQVVYYSASGRTYDCRYKRCELDQLLSNSDIVSIHAPLNEKTENLINYDALKQMKSSAVLLNLGRGPIVNDADLARALDEGLIAGAGLDVITKEPIEKDNPLTKIKDSSKLIITPHIAWATYEARCRLMNEVYYNIVAFLKGDKRNRIV